MLEEVRRVPDLARDCVTTEIGEEGEDAAWIVHPVAGYVVKFREVNFKTQLFFQTYPIHCIVIVAGGYRQAFIGEKYFQSFPEHLSLSRVATTN